MCAAAKGPYKDCKNSEKLTDYVDTKWHNHSCLLYIYS
jgi:hypothetical protein